VLITVLQRHVKMPIDTTSLTGLPDKISIISQTVLKRPEKGQTDCLKARK